MDSKRLLELILIFVLQFTDIGGQVITSHHYSRPGEDTTLKCATASPSDTTCSRFSWLYNRNRGQRFDEVMKGTVSKSSPRAARLSLDTDCSLVIHNVTTLDLGHYTCRQGNTPAQDAVTYLSFLTISPSPPDADPKRDGEVKLNCSLLRLTALGACQRNSIRWLNETGTELRGEQTGCVSVLTVKRQSGNNRKYTCQFFNRTKIEIEANYTPDFTGGITNDQKETTNSDPLTQLYIIIGAALGALLVLVFTTAVLLRCRKANVTEDVQKPTQPTDEPESNLTYATISHANQQVSPYRKNKEEEVTYSTVNTGQA